MYNLGNEFNYSSLDYPLKNSNTFIIVRAPSKLVREQFFRLGDMILIAGFDADEDQLVNAHYTGEFILPVVGDVKPGAYVYYSAGTLTTEQAQGAKFCGYAIESKGNSRWKILFQNSGPSIPGPQGAKGDRGEAGPQGERGAPGPKGEKGDKA